MNIKEIKEKLEKGAAFGNDAAGWYTINNPNKGVRIIVFVEGFWSYAVDNDTYKTYKNYTSFAKRVWQLMNKGC